MLSVEKSDVAMVSMFSVALLYGVAMQQQVAHQPATEHSYLHR